MFDLFFPFSERFFKCEGGRAIEFQCPVGQHWNVAMNYCDYPNNARCGSNNNWGNQPNWNQPQQPPMAPQQPNWNQPQQPPMVPQQPNWNQPISPILPPPPQQPQRPIIPQQPPMVPQLPPMIPQPPMIPDFQHPIDIPVARGK
jgi:hypothetical protein